MTFSTGNAQDGGSRRDAAPQSRSVVLQVE
jgi:hypothetical protein